MIWPVNNPWTRPFRFWMSWGHAWTTRCPSSSSATSLIWVILETLSTPRYCKSAKKGLWIWQKWAASPERGSIKLSRFCLRMSSKSLLTQKGTSLTQKTSSWLMQRLNKRRGAVVGSKERRVARTLAQKNRDEFRSKKESQSRGRTKRKERGVPLFKEHNLSRPIICFLRVFLAQANTDICKYMII